MRDMHPPERLPQAGDGRRRFVVTALVAILVVGTLLAGVLFSGRARGSSNLLGANPAPAPVTTAAHGESLITHSASAARSGSSDLPGPEPVATQSAHSRAGQATRAVALGCDGTPLAAPATANLGAAVEEVARKHGATVAVSWLDPGLGIVTVGELTDLPAWSTAKVPLALAAIATGDSEALRPTISAALTSSSNEAADMLWQSLGPDDQTRSLAVTALFRQAGDHLTTVPAQQIFPPYSVLGQTQWSTAAQLEFLQSMPCLSGADQVIGGMTAVVTAQRWGLGTKPNATFKGGWGPAMAGGYTVRQFGWYTADDGVNVPVAIAVEASSFDAGVAAMNGLVATLG